MAESKQLTALIVGDVFVHVMDFGHGESGASFVAESNAVRIG
jgi:hypothetical protein